MERSEKPTCGEIKEVFRDEGTAKFEWTIPNFLNNPKSGYYSLNVKYFNMICSFDIEKFREAIAIYLHRKNEETSVIPGPVRSTIGYKKADGSEEDLVRDSGYRYSEMFLWWCKPMLQTTSSGDFTLTCTLWNDETPYADVISRITQREVASCTRDRIDEHPLKGVCRATQAEDAPYTDSGIHKDHSKGLSRATQRDDASCTNSRIDEDHIEDISILSEHFKNLLLSGDDHDFLIKVKDEQFGTHKYVLRARSPVFAAMFRSKMTESADDSVTVDDCDPAAFGEFLRCVYTGKVDMSSASHALGLYHAGDKYDFPRLKVKCVEFLKNSLAATRISDVINLAVWHDEEALLQQALAYLATHLEEVMLTVEWQRFLSANPIQANEMCIKALQCVKEG